MPRKIQATTETMPATATPAASTNRRVRRAAPKTEAAPTKATAPKAEPVATPVEATTPATETVVSEEATLLAELASALEKVKAEKARLNEIGKGLTVLVEDLVKKTTKALRKSSKAKRPRRNANPNSGFQKPVPVTDELCKFLNKPAGTLISRTDVSAMIREYIKENNLQNPSDRRIVIPNRDLSALLRLEKDETITYFTLQSKLSHLFVKSDSA